MDVRFCTCGEEKKHQEWAFSSYYGCSGDKIQVVKLITCIFKTRDMSSVPALPNLSDIVIIIHSTVCIQRHFKSRFSTVCGKELVRTWIERHEVRKVI